MQCTWTQKVDLQEVMDSNVDEVQVGKARKGMKRGGLVIDRKN